MASDSRAEEQACVQDNDGVGWHADGLAFCQVPTPLHSQEMTDATDKSTHALRLHQLTRRH